MWRLLTLSVAQSLLLSGGQVLLKFALEKMGSFEWTWAFFRPPARELVVSGMRPLLRRRHDPVDVHPQEVSVQYGLPDDQPELCVRNARGDIHIPREYSRNEVDRSFFDHQRLRVHS